MRCASARSTEPIEIISIARREPFAGTVIMVATQHRERQSVDCLVVGDDFVIAGRQQAIDAPDPKRMGEGDDFTA
jgi:hypothetical protein